MLNTQNQLQVLFNAFENTQYALTDSDLLNSDRYHELLHRFDKKKANPELSIMVYGVYNAGKSTFINALLGQESAPVGDVPLTHKVDSYPYKNYTIQDTPGIDAPKEHEQVTDGQLEKADAVLFVVNPSGVAEEKDTLDKLIFLFKKHKKVFLIFNEKTPFSEEDFIKIKDQTRKRLQDIALEHGIKEEILKDIPIFKINAKTALKGKLEDKPKLVEHSGINLLEKELNKFIDEIINNNEVYHSLKSSLADFIDDNIEILQKRYDNNIKKQYDNLVKEIYQDRTLLLNSTKSRINRLQSQLSDNIKTWLRDNPKSAEQQIENWVNAKVNVLHEDMSHDFESLTVKLQSQIEDVQVSLPQLSQEDIGKVEIAYQELLKDGKETDFDSEKIGKVIDGIDPKHIANVVGKVAPKITEQHIVMTLQLTKKYLPTLMKGIGTKTMEKMAKTVSIRFLPFIGPVISVGFELWDMQKESQNAQKMQQTIDEQNRQRERYYQQISDTAHQISGQIGDELRHNLVNSINEFFAQFMDFIKSTRQAFSEQEQKNSQVLSSLTAVKQELANV
jgi:GTP-binding protein, HSR1-related